MYGAKRYILNATFGNNTSPNRRSSAPDAWGQTSDWGNDGGGWYPGSTSISPGGIKLSDEFIVKNNILEQNILP